MRRKLQRRSPLPAVFQIFRAMTEHHLRPGGDVFAVSAGNIVPGRHAHHRACVDHIRVTRINGDVPALAAADFSPVRGDDGGVTRPARDAHRGVVLLGTIDPVGERSVCRQVIELASRLVVDTRPALAAIECHQRAAVIAQDHVAGIVRVYPEIMVVTVRRRHKLEGLPGVDRLPHLDI